jgi:hypothetical protein
MGRRTQSRTGPNQGAWQGGEKLSANTLHHVHFSLP